MNYFALAVQNARREFAPAPPMDLSHRESHPCGRCAQPAAYFDRSLASGAVAFICTKCDPRGHLTLVSPSRRGEV